MKEEKKSNKLYRCLSSNNSVGVEFKENIINVYFPLGYNLDDLKSETEEKRAILDLLKTISICKNNGESEEYDYGDGPEEYLPINSYLWIINDYLKNGLYTVFEKKYIQSQNGTINWKKTFKTKPLFNDEEIVYLNPITELKTQYDNIITEIHALCVNISIQKVGWIFGKINVIENYKQSYKDEIYLDILNRELSKSFNDRKKTLLKHLIKIIKRKSDDDKADIVNNLLVNNYNYAWEKMIDYVFGNVIDKKKYFPEIVWNLHNGRNPKPTMRPDTIVKNDESIYILDAKYYKYGVEYNGSLPGVESVDKQITYGEYNVFKHNTDKVYNAFVMPFNMGDSLFKSNNPIITVGTVKSVGRSSTGFPYENIVIVLMDTKYLFDLYFKKSLKSEDILINNILKELNIAN